MTTFIYLFFERMTHHFNLLAPFNSAPPRAQLLYPRRAKLRRSFTLPSSHVLLQQIEITFLSCSVFQIHIESDQLQNICCSLFQIYTPTAISYRILSLRYLLVGFFPLEIYWRLSATNIDERHLHRYMICPEIFQRTMLTKYIHRSVSL